MLPTSIKELGFIPIFMYNLDYLDNKNVQLENENKTHLYGEVIGFTMTNLTDTIELLKGFDIVAFIPSGDDDTIDVDYFSNLFSTLANPLETSLCRRDKYHMQEAIRKCGLKNIHQRRCSREEDIIGFVSENPNIQYVIKPVFGSSTEDVYLCSTIETLLEKYSIIMQSDLNHYDISNKSCLIQEYIDGEEWIVNSISRNGIHKIVNVMKYKKACVNGRHFTYQETRIIDPKCVPLELYIYAINVLNALDFKTGAGHAEIKMSSKGPCLIEIGARVGGGQRRNFIQKCIVPCKGESAGYDQEIAHLYAYCSQELFDKIPSLYSVCKVGATVFCNSLYDNIVWKNIYIKELLIKLAETVTVQDITYSYSENKKIVKTCDFYTDLIDFDIVCDNETHLEQAIQLIRDWEISLLDISYIHCDTITN